MMLVNLDQELIWWGKLGNLCRSLTDVFMPWGVLYLIISYGKPPWSAVSFLIQSESGIRKKGGLASWPRSGCWAIRNMVTHIYYRLSFRDRISKWLPKVNPPHLWDISFPKLQAAWLCFSGEWNWDKDHWMPDLQWLCGKTYQIGQGTKGWFLLIVWKKNSQHQRIQCGMVPKSTINFDHVCCCTMLLHNHLPPEIEYF